jgi:hypothetical protein
VHDPANAWHPSEYATRVSIVHPSHRAHLRMAEGVDWERLAATPERDVNFMKITYAPGAAGNLATEDLVSFLDTSGWESGVSLDGVLVAARFIADALGRPLATKVGQAGGWDPATGAATGRA